MHCTEFDQRLNELLDARALPQEDPALLFHAEMCAACSRQLETWCQLGAQLNPTYSPDLSDRFAKQVISQVSPSTTTGPLLAIASAVTALAAALLLWTTPTWHTERIHSASLSASTSVSAIEERPFNAEDTAVYRELLAGLFVRLSDSTRDELQTVDPIADSLRPITVTLSAALGALKSSLAGSDNRMTDSPDADSAGQLPLLTDRLG